MSFTFKLFLVLLLACVFTWNIVTSFDKPVKVSKEVNRSKRG